MPEASAVTVPSSVLPSKMLMVLLASAVPDGAVGCRSASGWRRWCCPVRAVVGVKVQLPEASAVVVPSSVVPSRMLMVLLASLAGGVHRQREGRAGGA